MCTDNSSQQKSNLKFYRNHRYWLIGATFAILLLAICNHICITWNIDRNYRSVLTVLSRLDSVCNPDSSFICSNRLDNQTDSLLIRENVLPEWKRISEETLGTFRQILYEMESSKKGLFDSNVVTFLISFVLVGLIAIFFENDKKIADRIREIEAMRVQIKQEIDEKIDEMDTFRIEAGKRISLYEERLNVFQSCTLEDQQITQVMNNIQTIQLIAIQLNIELVQSKMNRSSAVNEYARMIDTETKEIIDKLNTGKIHDLSSQHKETLLNILNKILAYISSGSRGASDSQAFVYQALLGAEQRLTELCGRIEMLSVRP